MANRQLALASERWLDEVLVAISIVDIDGEQSDDFLLPAGIGDLAIMELDVTVGPIATLAANIELMAVRATIRQTSGLVADIIGNGPFRRHSATAYSAYISPDPLVLWRQNEPLRLAWPELDTNAAPTADAFINVKCVRIAVRQVETTGPLRLVR